MNDYKKLYRQITASKYGFDTDDAIKLHQLKQELNAKYGMSREDNKMKRVMVYEVDDKLFREKEEALAYRREKEIRRMVQDMTFQQILTKLSGDRLFRSEFIRALEPPETIYD